MEEIKDKAFDDELNKAEDRIEKVDKMPLPPHRNRKERKDGEADEEH